MVVGFNKGHTKEDWRNNWYACKSQRHIRGFSGSALDVYGWGVLFWANFARNEGMGLDHARVSEVGHIKINEGRFATCVGGITKDNQSNSKCLGYNCEHDDILQIEMQTKGASHRQDCWEESAILDIISAC